MAARPARPYGNGVKAHIAKGGRLISVDGAPLAGLPASAGAAIPAVISGRHLADCPVNSTVAACAGTSAAGRGGYTLRTRRRVRSDDAERRLGQLRNHRFDVWTRRDWAAEAAVSGSGVIIGHLGTNVVMRFFPLFLA